MASAATQGIRDGEVDGSQPTDSPVPRKRCLVPGLRTVGTLAEETDDGPTKLSVAGISGDCAASVAARAMIATSWTARISQLFGTSVIR